MGILIQRDDILVDMGGTPEGVSTEALEDIAYLTRSNNRVALLTTMARGSYSRRKLHEATGIARTTIGRILTEFEERNWVERTANGTYTTTPMGHSIASELRPFVESIETIQTLGNLVDWLHGIDTRLDLRQLRDAAIMEPEHDDPMEVIDQFIDRLHHTAEFYTLNQIAPAGKAMEIMRDRLDRTQLVATFVVTGELVDYILDRPERRTRWRACIESGAEVYRYDGSIPCSLLMLDETVFIANTQATYGDPYTMIQSDNDAVRSWAREIIIGHQTDAARLDATFFEDPTTTGSE